MWNWTWIRRKGEKTMMKRNLLVLFVLLLVNFCVGTNSVSAQDCANNCRVCAEEKWEGYGYHPEGPYNMTCTWTGPGGGCSQAFCGPGAVNEDWIPASAVAEVVESALISELPALLEAYGDRLLFSPERNAVVIKGIQCDADRLEIMVALPAELARAFEDSEVGRLRIFLAEKQQAT